jgi:hypothetical protein
MTADEYLRQKFGAPRAHPEWRDLKAAFEAGEAAAAVPDKSRYAEEARRLLHQFAVTVTNAEANAVRDRFDAVIDLLATRPASTPTAAAGEPEPLCACKDRPATQCKEQWGPACDMGNNAKHAALLPVAQQAHPDPAKLVENIKHHQNECADKAWHAGNSDEQVGTPYYETLSLFNAALDQLASMSIPTAEIDTSPKPVDSGDTSGARREV